ncbi:MAG: DUF6691 family protein [Pseudomonadota bacterium]
MRVLVAFLTGSIFGLGLMLSGMTDTGRVQGFLDVAGAWDPTLIFVLGGAVLPMALTWRIAAARSGALLGGPIPKQVEARVDRDLIVGSALFGAGWALVGLCPGPAMASLFYGGTGGLVFLIAMAAGMIGYRRVTVGVPA